jgi:hypothetical protein
MWPLLKTIVAVCLETYVNDPYFFIYLSVYLYICLSLYLFIYISICLPLYLFIYLSICGSTAFVGLGRLFHFY